MRRLRQSRGQELIEQALAIAPICLVVVVAFEVWPRLVAPVSQMPAAGSAQ
jgi:hypothetical protein